MKWLKMSGVELSTRRSFLISTNTHIPFEMDLKTAIALGTPHFSAKGKPDICCNCCHGVSFVVLDQARQLLLTVI